MTGPGTLRASFFNVRSDPSEAGIISDILLPESELARLGLDEQQPGERVLSTRWSRKIGAGAGGDLAPAGSHCSWSTQSAAVAVGRPATEVIIVGTSLQAGS